MPKNANGKRARDVSDDLERARVREALLNRPRNDSLEQLHLAKFRLERIINIVKARPFAEVAAELKQLSHTNAQIITDLMGKYEDTVGAIRKETVDLREELVQAKQDVEGLEERKNVLDFQVPRRLERVRDYEAHLKAMARTITENSVKLITVEGETKKIKDKLDMATDRTDPLRARLEEAQRSAEEATKEALKAQSDARTVQEDIDLLLAQSGSQILDLEDQTNNLGNSPEELERALTQAFQEQLELIIEERKRQFELENKEGVKELRERYQQKWVEYDHQLLQNERANASQQNKLQELLAEIKQAKAEEADLAAKLHEKVREADAKQVEIDRRNRLYLDISAKNKTQLETLRAAKNKKDREYDDLMDLKVALAMEIKAYTNLLENEEDRLGYVSPIKKVKSRA